MTRQTTNQAAAEAAIKKTTGVELHGGKLRIWFMYPDKSRTRHRITMNDTVNSKNVNALGKFRANIVDAIKDGSFKWDDFFPDMSPPAELRALMAQNNKSRTVGESLDLWLSAYEGEVAPSTFRMAANKANNHLRVKFGDWAIDQVTYSDLVAWRNELLKDYKSKTVNDIFTPVRAVFGAAFEDGLIERDPCKRIKNLKRDAALDSAADPFDREELAKLAATTPGPSHRGQPRESEKNMVMFACYMGLSISEMLGMAWEDVDWERGCLHVRRALVLREWKVPKEQSRNRVIPILDSAMPYLKAQRAISELLQPIQRDVLQRDNREKVSESFRPVWVNTDSQAHHTDDFVISHRFFKTFCKKADVRWRPINQCRHTFASQMLTAGKPPHEVARHMGHTGLTMLYRHYAKWIDGDVDYKNHVLQNAN